MRPGSSRVNVLFVLVLAATTLFYAVIFVQIKEYPITSGLSGKSIRLPVSDFCAFTVPGEWYLQEIEQRLTTSMHRCNTALDYCRYSRLGAIPSRSERPPNISYFISILTLC